MRLYTLQLALIVKIVWFAALLNPDYDGHALLII
jgi:hypothetical protein